MNAADIADEMRQETRRIVREELELHRRLLVEALADAHPRTDPGTYTVYEVAALMKVTSETIYRMIKQGKIPLVMVDGLKHKRISGQWVHEHLLLQEAG